MKQFTNFDYLYAVFMLLFGLFMIFSPDTFLRKVKYDEERVKAQNWLKKIGIALCIMAPLFAIYLYYKMNA